MPSKFSIVTSVPCCPNLQFVPQLVGPAFHTSVSTLLLSPFPTSLILYLPGFLALKVSSHILILSSLLFFRTGLFQLSTLQCKKLLRLRSHLTFPRLNFHVWRMWVGHGIVG